MLSDRERDQFGYLLEEVLKGLPDKAAALLKNVAITVEDRPPNPPLRESDVLGHAPENNPQLSQYWRVPEPGTAGIPGSLITLYQEPILARGGDTSTEIEDVLLRAIERKKGLSEGALDSTMSPEGLNWVPDADNSDDLVPDPLDPDVNDRLVEIAESEVELLTPTARDWLSGVEIVAVERPEAEGDPRRLADFPEDDDEPRALVLYADNIMKSGQSPEIVIRRLLREAASRAGTL